METPPNMIDSDGITISQAEVDRFVAATRSEHLRGIPPTFLTIYRKSEFDLLNELQVNWRYLLHAEQEYEYLGPLTLNKEPVAVSKVVDQKERRRREEVMRFIKTETDFFIDDKLVAKGRSTFVVREPVEAA
ncbi:MAG: MaoC family dehydratase N-terminal domain-containing protein [Bdellovibrionaceae bacterium]|nr:MaoC family dehydratase N-terminal domain-containing protein [Bdellovibrionales bacterium]MCB9254800.1 MaoC family dehydratase N-terminal domain-containing protein [Pseudobdellovibrionaceae bacterium]